MRRLDGVRPGPKPAWYSNSASRCHKVQQLNAIVVARPFKHIGMRCKDTANISVEKQHLVKPRKYGLNILIYVGLVFNLVIV
jgi:hypothetical protein